MFDEIVLSIFILLLPCETFLFDSLLARFLDDIIVEHLIVVISTTAVYSTVIWPLIFEETVSGEPIAQLVRVRDLVKDNLHNGVSHEVIISTTSDEEISLQELLKLLYNHLVSSLFLILFTLRVWIVDAFQFFFWVEALIFANSLLREILFFECFRRLKLAHGFEVHVCFVIEEELIEASRSDLTPTLLDQIQDLSDLGYVSHVSLGEL